jgi:hypothetical protein
VAVQHRYFMRIKREELKLCCGNAPQAAYVNKDVNSDFLIQFIK